MKQHLVRMDWEMWLYSLMTAAIGGGATTVTAWLGMAAAHSVGVDVPLLNFKALGVIWISGAATSFFAYLKQSPLPPLISETTTTVTVKTETTGEPPVEIEPKKP